MPPFILMSHQSLMLALILLQGIRCDAVRTCQFDDSKFFLEYDNAAAGRDVSAGECSFDENTFCGYSQACTDKDARNWILKNGEAVCPGKSGVFDSFSVLLSPLITFKQDYCLKFKYSQFSPGKLSVFLATPSQLIDIKPEEAGEGNFSRLIQLRPPVGKIGFKARSPDTNQEITLSYVKLQAGSCAGSVPDQETAKVTSPTYSQPATHLSTQADQETAKITSPSYSQPATHLSTQADQETAKITSPSYSQPATHLSTQAELADNPEAAEDNSVNNAAIVAGAIVAVIVVAGVFVLGVFIWRRRKKELHGNPKAGVTSQDTRNMSPFVSGVSSSNKLSANGFENPTHTKNKSTNGVLDTGNNYYNIPRNGQPARHAANTESRPFPARASPSAGDDDGHSHYILEEYITAAAPQTPTSVYSYARGEEHSSSKSYCLDADYNRIGSAEARSRGRSEAGSDAVEDEYTYIASTDAVAGVRSQALASRPTGWNGHPGQSSAASEGDSSCDQHTSLDCEDGYSVLSAGNKQIKVFNNQRSEGAEKAYGRLASNIHGDYDRIRCKDRDDVLGNDYDQVGGHTEGHYDETGLTDKKIVIGNDYAHLG